MSDPATAPVPQPLIYVIHDDQDRAVADLVTRHLSAEGMPAWCRGQRPPRGQGADNVLKKARAIVLVGTDHAVQSQLVHVDLTRAGRDNIPMARLILQESAASFGSDYPAPAGAITAYGDLDEPTMTSLFDLVRPLAVRGLFSFSRPKGQSAVEDERAEPATARQKKNTGATGPDAASLGLKLTMFRLAPLALVGLAFLGGGLWWWMGQARDTAAQDMRRRAADRAPLTKPMQDLAAGKLVESVTAQSNGEKLPPGIRRAGYDAEPGATDAQVADAASLLEVTRISRSAFKVKNGDRTCDVQVTVSNQSDKSLPVVALTVSLRDNSNLNLSERLLKVERRWIQAGGTRVIEGKLSDLPKWAQSISIKVSPTKG
jgi:hypothetical protein